MATRTVDPLASLLAQYNDALARAEGEAANEKQDRLDPDGWLLARGWHPGRLYGIGGGTPAGGGDDEGGGGGGDEGGGDTPSPGPGPSPTPTPEPTPDQQKLIAMVEMCTGGRNTVRFNKDGVPSIFYRLPMFYLDDIVSTWPHEPHPAFIINDQVSGQPLLLREILIGVYESSLYDGRYAVSQPGKLPLSYIPFDLHVAYARANNMPGGITVEYSRSDPNNYTITRNGELDTQSYWHAMTNAEYAAIALWCEKKGYEPRGNGWYGLNKFHPEEKGTLPTSRYSHNTQEEEPIYNAMPGTPGVRPADDVNVVANCPTLTGTSPLAWRHDGSACGIENLVGNTFCEVVGTRVLDGQIQSFVNNNAALPDADLCGRTPLSPGGTLDNRDWKEQRYYTESWKGFKAFDVNGEFINVPAPAPDEDAPVTAWYLGPEPTQPALTEAGAVAREHDGTTLKIDGSYLADGTPTPSGNWSYGCGSPRINTVISIPDSGGTAEETSKFSRNSATGEFYFDPENGVANGSAPSWFSLLQVSADDPSDDSGEQHTREVDAQPGYMMRALGLYPVCAHSDLWDSYADAQAIDRPDVDPETGDPTVIVHDGYYYNDGYVPAEGEPGRDEARGWYNKQAGRMWTRARGELFHIRGGTYYYESVNMLEDRPPSDLWTQSFTTQRYDRLVELNPEGSDIGVGWVGGSRLCLFENPIPFPVKETT